MKSEESFFIEEVTVRTTRNGKGIVEERHIQSEADIRYYQASKETENRYRIWWHYGPIRNPACLYRVPAETDLYYFSGNLNATRKYLRELDQTYFKFYDDAEEVLNNIILFIQWLKNPPAKLKEKKTFLKILEKYQSLITDKAVSAEWVKTRQSQIGLQPKRRDALTRLRREVQDEMDLVPELERNL